MKTFTIYWSFETEDTPDGYDVQLSFHPFKKKGMREFSFNTSDISEYWVELLNYFEEYDLSYDIGAEYNDDLEIEDEMEKVLACLAPGQLESIFCEFLNDENCDITELLQPLHDEAEKILDKEREDLQFG
jgi:hypothetical protein